MVQHQPAFAHDPVAWWSGNVTEFIATADAELLGRLARAATQNFPDRVVPKNAAAEAILRKRTLTNLYNTRGTPDGAWLDDLHRVLHAAVAAAYGWPADLPDDEVLARLLALNHERASMGRS